ncbi:MAG: hypothetical protein ACRBF0_17770 [Calditrichia bacterium]
MKRWVIFVVMVILLSGLVFLVSAGYITWQPLTIIAAALAAPFRFIIGWFTSSEEDIRDRHRKIREQEKRFRDKLDNKVKDREKNIDIINKEIELLDAEMELLKKKKDLVELEVGNMSDEELLAEWKKRFGTPTTPAPTTDGPTPEDS